ncbi:hypothetical protein GFB49_19410 [Epibacterium sp. SM1979]|uniref:Uncharacterized protein n=1 Tax=Tritonibacter litoralis TaxID=2662264 RepID=A0A843YPW1_9RHOB|nr:hypothetical protein [Tritonibacter litoralis]MQQ10627.1 hypothetical protein [Tritonibacter litoralis]
MSFLPYAPPRPWQWRLSTGLSFSVHGGVAAALFAGSVSFLPSLRPMNEPEEDFALVSIDVLNPVQVLEPEEETPTLLTPEDPENELLPAADELAEALEPEVISEQVAEDIEPEELLPDLPAEIAEVEPVEEQPVLQELEAVETPEVFEGAEQVAVLPVEESIEADVIAADEPVEEQPLQEPPAAEVVAESGFEVEDNTFDIATKDLLEIEGQGVGFGDTLPPQDVVSLDTAGNIQEPESVGPDLPEDTIGAVDDAGTGSQQLATLLPEVVETGPLDTPRKAQIITAPNAQMRGIGQLIHQIRAAPQPQCGLLLPRRGSNGGLGLSMIGADDLLLNAAADRIVDRVDATVARHFDSIDLRQCAALDALRLSAAYPASRLGLVLEQSTLNSGDSLRARVVGAGGLNLTLLLIDDNGVVQDLSRFATIEGDVVEVDAPVVRVGTNRDTKQLLFALGHGEASFNLENEVGQLAQDVFSSLSTNLLEDSVFGMAAFQVLQ